MNNRTNQKNTPIDVLCIMYYSFHLSDCRLDAVCRPVLILGPLADSVADKLTIDFPQLFQRCLTTTMNCTQDAMEKGLQSNIFVDYRRRGSIYECTTVQAIRELGVKVH